MAKYQGKRYPRKFTPPTPHLKDNMKAGYSRAIRAVKDVASSVKDAFGGKPAPAQRSIKGSNYHPRLSPKKK